jgi:CTP:molybdopterin cytidylyltransferase MocA
MRRLPWTGPEGMAEYGAPGEVDQIADRTEAHTISMARNDAAYALTMAERPEVSRAELRALIGKLARAVKDVASVAELRGERLSEPVYGPAARALEEALRTALSQR